jgi:hypothetical protein
VYLIAVAVMFNAVALGGITVAAGQAAPVQIAVGLSVFALLAAFAPMVVRSMRVIGERRMNATGAAHTSSGELATSRDASVRGPRTRSARWT